jgi:hypothetical protein
MQKVTTCFTHTHTHTHTFKRTCASVFATILLLIFTGMKVNAQTPNWTQTYGSAFNDYGYSIEKTYDGGYIIGGTTSDDEDKKDILLLKLNSDGDTVWTRNLGSTYNDESYSVKQCRDSGFIVCGYKSNGSNSLDFYIIKTNASGTLAWNRTYGGALNEGSYSIIQTLDDGFAVCGYTASTGAGAKDMLLLKYNSNGYLQWQQNYGGLFDEVAYALAQTPDSGYMLAGTSKSYNNSTLNDVYCVRTNAQGDTLWTKNYAMAGNDIAYSVTVTNGNYFLIAGKSNTYNTTTTANYSAFALKINMQGNVLFFETYGTDANDVCAYTVKEMPDLSYVLAGTRADALCKLYYPRYIWVNNVYNVALKKDSVNVLNPDSSQLYQTRLDHLVSYLSTLKYSGAIITHLEDIFEDSAATTLQTQLQQVVTTMHTHGIPVVLNQFRGNEINRNPTVSKNKELDYLALSNLYNQAAPPLARFDGLELDYEFWQKVYGRANRWDTIGGIPVFILPFANIYTGYQNYLTIANAFKLAKADTANHYKILAQWIGQVFDCDSLNLDLDTIFNEVDDDQALMYTFDSLQFDRLVLSFFLEDTLVSNNPYNPLKDPLAFLKRPAIGNEINQYFSRLYLLGQNNYPTNVIPQFHAGEGDGGDSKLIKYLHGTGSWWGLPHYLNEAEQEFQNQYNDQDPILFTYQGLSSNDPYHFGTTNIFGGFEWFRYQIGPLEFAQLSARINDKIKSTYNPCVSVLRTINNATHIAVTSKVTYQERAIINVVVTGSSITLTVKNHDFQNTDAISVACYDALGRGISNTLTVQEVIVGNTTSINLQRNGLSGLLFFKVYEDSVCIGATKVLIFKK